MPDLPSHASPVLAPQPRTSSHYLADWDHESNGLLTPSLPNNLLSPAFTPPTTPGFSGTTTPSRREPRSVPVDTSLDPPTLKHPRLLERLPIVECVVRARIPTTSGAEMFLHLYQNNVDNKEHLAIVFGNNIRSRSLDREREGESEMDRMIRGAYVGRLRPGRISSRYDGNTRTGSGKRRKRESGLRNVQTVVEGEVLNPTTNGIEQSHKQPTPLDQITSDIHQTNHHTDTIDEDDTSSPSSDPDETSHTTTNTQPPLVRIHSECYTGETAWSARCDCGEQLDEAARLMSLPPHPGGVIVYLRQEGRGIGLSEKLKAYNLQDLGSDTVEANLLLRHPADARSYGLATAILLDLGCGGDKGIRLLTNNPDKVRAVEGPGREVRVRERVAMVPLAWRTGGRKGIHSREIEAYLSTKIGKMGHMIGDDQPYEEGGGGGNETREEGVTI